MVSEKVTLVILLPLLEFHRVRVLGLSITASNSRPVSCIETRFEIGQLY